MSEQTESNPLAYVGWVAAFVVVLDLLARAAAAVILEAARSLTR